MTSVKLDVECGPHSTILSLMPIKRLTSPLLGPLYTVIFFRLKPPLVPTEMVRALCESAQQAGAGSIRSKFLHRLTPISRTGKATVGGLEGVAKAVLEPHFHSGQTGVKVCDFVNGVWCIWSFPERQEGRRQALESLPFARLH